MICLYARSQKNSGVEFLVGFESESILLNNTNPFEAINDHGWSTAQAFKSVTTGTYAVQIAQKPNTTYFKNLSYPALVYNFIFL